MSVPPDSLILVDEQDREIGTSSKPDCHRGDGLLHRAFSVFLFNTKGEVLLQQRSDKKPLWPLYWSNSCCSHPRLDEPVQQAATRRVREELSAHCTPRFLYKFRYQARFGDAGSENEYCWVYSAVYDGPVDADPSEIADCRYIDPKALSAELAQNGEAYTPWLKLEWKRISEDFLDTILDPILDTGLDPKLDSTLDTAE
jgi:isopentenyl-diphosphate delta-isomerase